MKRLKSKKGSIIPGLMFFIIIIIIMFTYMFETGLLFIMKQRSESAVKNVSAAVVLQIDEDLLFNYGELGLKGNQEDIANQIIEGSNLKTKLFPNIEISIKEENPNNKQINIEVEINMPQVQGLVFYKDATIKSNSRHKITYDDAFLQLEEGEELTLEDMLELVIFEEVFE